MTIWIGSRSQIWSTPSGFDMEPKKMTLSVGNFLSETSFFLSSVCVFSGINSYEKLWLNEPMSKDIYIYIS
jgi:hypothetical protein